MMMMMIITLISVCPRTNPLLLFSGCQLDYIEFIMLMYMSHYQYLFNDPILLDGLPVNPNTYSNSITVLVLLMGFITFQ